MKSRGENCVWVRGDHSFWLCNYKETTGMCRRLSALSSNAVLVPMLAVMETFCRILLSSPLHDGMNTFWQPINKILRSSVVMVSTLFIYKKMEFSDNGLITTKMLWRHLKVEAFQNRVILESSHFKI